MGTATGLLDHPGIAKVRAALADAGLSFAANGIRVLDAEVRTAIQAAEAIGVGVGAIANSLVFRTVTGETTAPLLALTSGRHRADPGRLAELAAADAVIKADPAFVRTSTGQVIGAVAPVGHPAPIRTLVDSALAEYPVIWAAAGHPRAVFPIGFAELVALTCGTAAVVAIEEDDRTP